MSISNLVSVPTRSRFRERCLLAAERLLRSGTFISRALLVRVGSDSPEQKTAGPLTTGVAQLVHALRAYMKSS